MRTEFLKFIIVGGASTVINYAVFFVLLSTFNWNYLLSSGCGFFSGVLFGYFFNKLWTFKVEDSSARLLLNYYLVYLGSLLISLLFLKITVDFLGMDAKIANVLAIGITTCTNFIGIKFWAFGKR